VRTKESSQDSRSRHVTKMTRRHKKKPNERQLNTSTHPQIRRTSPCEKENWDWETWSSCERWPMDM